MGRVRRALLGHQTEWRSFCLWPTRHRHNVTRPPAQRDTLAIHTSTYAHTVARRTARCSCAREASTQHQLFQRLPISEQCRLLPFLFDDLTYDDSNDDSHMHPRAAVTTVVPVINDSKEFIFLFHAQQKTHRQRNPWTVMVRALVHVRLRACELSSYAADLFWRAGDGGHDGALHVVARPSHRLPAAARVAPTCSNPQTGYRPIYK